MLHDIALYKFNIYIHIYKVAFCCSVLAGTSGRLLSRLQSVLNAAARLILSARKSDHTTLMLRELQWLRVPEQIQFRLCVLVYRCLHGTAPSYLADCLRRSADIDGRRRLRSPESNMLVIASMHRSTLGDRSFPVAASRAWNGLTASVRAATSLVSFSKELKTGSSPEEL